MTAELRALSLTQPWATLVAIGAKKIETRSWQTSYRGWVAIHATKGSPPEGDMLLGQEPFRSVLAQHRIFGLSGLPHGAIVAVAQLVDCLSTSSGRPWSPPWVQKLTVQEIEFGDYGPRRFGWFLEDVRALPNPIICRGYQGLWPVPADIAAQIERQLSAGSLGR